MARLTRAARKKKRRSIVMAIFMMALISIAGGASVYAYMSMDKAPDKVTLCPEAGALGHYVVLVDNTEPYTFMQRQAFQQRLDDLASKTIPEGYLVSIFVLGSDFKENAEPVFEKCNPGLGVGKTEWTSNLQRIKRRFEESFREPILKVSETVLMDQPSDRSPIFEMLQIASINGFRAKKVESNKHLIIFSDMLPNTQEFSMFKGVPTYKLFKDSSYGRKSMTDLGGVKVELNYLLNYPTLQSRGQLGFWESYFEDAGARLIAVDTMEG